MKPLTIACAEEHADYFQARLALIRGEIRGEMRGRRWFCDEQSLQTWKQVQDSEPAPAA